MTGQNFVLFEQREAIVTLTLNAPEARNALSSQAQWDAVVAACERVQADPAVKVVILTGAGSAFCAGGNVKDFRDKRGLAAGSGMDVRDNYRRGIQRIPLAFHRLDVPTIAAAAISLVSSASWSCSAVSEDAPNRWARCPANWCRSFSIRIACAFTSARSRAVKLRNSSGSSGKVRV